MQLIEEAVAAGARRQAAAELLGLSLRTLQRWWCQGPEAGTNATGRTAPQATSSARGSAKQVLDVVNQPAYRDLPPHQIVPRLLDEQQRYLAW